MGRASVVRESGSEGGCGGSIATDPWLRRYSGLAGNRKVASSIPSECRGVPERDALTLTAPDELAVALRGRHRRRYVNVCVCVTGWMLGDVVKRFEWPLVRKALYNCSLFTRYPAEQRQPISWAFKSSEGEEWGRVAAGHAWNIRPLLFTRWSGLRPPTLWVTFKVSADFSSSALHDVVLFLVHLDST